MKKSHAAIILVSTCIIIEQVINNGWYETFVNLGIVLILILFNCVVMAWFIYVGIQIFKD